MPRAASTKKNRPLAVAAGITKEQRKRERKQIGKLRHQIVSTSTEKRYEASFTQFLSFHQLPRHFSMPAAAVFDDLVAEYVEHLWEEGSPKSEANYSLASIQFFRPETKHRLPWSWKLVKVWNTLEFPQRATPLTPELLMSVAGQAFRWRQFEFGWLVVVGFTLFLRTGEMLSLRKQDVVLRGSSGVVFLAPSKGAKRTFLPLERVEILEDQTRLAFRHLCANKAPGDPLWSQSRTEFMSLWHSIFESLKLQGCNFFPYSLRRGGASSAYRQGASLDQLVTRGRWSHVATARLYLDLGLQSLTSLTLPSASHPLLARARAAYVAVSQKGTHGRRGAPALGWPGNLVSGWCRLLPF